MIEAKVEGLSDLAAAFKALPDAIRDKNNGPLRPALRAAAQVVADEAKRLAPEDSGVTRDAINVLSDRNPTDVTERAVVKVSKAKRVATLDGEQVPYWWMFFEIGTEKMGARPFMRPALDSKATEAIAKFVQRFAAGIQRAVRKVAKGKLRG